MGSPLGSGALQPCHQTRLQSDPTRLIRIAFETSRFIKPDRDLSRPGPPSWPFDTASSAPSRSFACSSSSWTWRGEERRRSIMSMLPDEIWTRILEMGTALGCLTYRDLCALAIASRRLNRLARDPALWATLLALDFPAGRHEPHDKATSVKSLYRIRCAPLPLLVDELLRSGP